MTTFAERKPRHLGTWQNPSGVAIEHLPEGLHLPSPRVISDRKGGSLAHLHVFFYSNFKLLAPKLGAPAKLPKSVTHDTREALEQTPQHSDDIHLVGAFNLDTCSPQIPLP